MVWIDVMDITKWSISGSEKSVPACTENKESPERAGASSLGMNTP
jgi:hypothetical protein